MKDKVEKITGVLGVTELFPEKIERGKVTISSFEFSNDEDPFFNLRAVRDGGRLFMMYDGKYTRLHIQGEGLVMSDTFMERKSNSEFIKRVNGKVLIAGLGLGLVLHNILQKEEVTEILVIEKCQDVIDLVGPKFENPKLKIICEDIIKWRPKKNEKFDTIYFDIWAGISTDNLKEIQVLHNAFKRYVNRDNPSNFMNSWMKEYLQKMKRKDRYENRYWGC